MTSVKAGVHTREYGSVTSAAEKRLLIWMATRLPARINSDHLSALGLAAIAGAGLAFATMRYSRWAAVAVVLSLIANWFGDSLDGTLARVRSHQRPRYGYYVDHIIDVAGTTLLLAGIACSALITPLTAVAALAAYLAVSAEAYLATHAAGVFRMSFLGFGPTELRIVLAIGAVKGAYSPVVSIAGLPDALLFDVGATIAIIGMAFAFVNAAIHNTRALYAAEPLPSSRASRAA